MGTHTVDADEFLEHWGVKGMHWGVRNARRKAAKAEKKSAKADSKWQKNIYSIHGAVAVHNHVADTMNNGELDALNNTPKFKNHVDKGGKLLDLQTGAPVGKIGQQYMDDYTSRVEKAHRTAVSAIHGTSPSGKYKAELDTSNPNQWAVKVSPTGETKHSDLVKTTDKTSPALVINVDHDDSGGISTHAKVKADNMGQSDPAGVFLTHWGVKGMKWGVRNPRKRSSSGSGKSEGTNNRPQAHELSDEELKKHVARMELEKKYKDLANPKKSSSTAHDFVKKHGTQLAGAAVQQAGNFAVQQALKKAFKG